MKTSSLRPLLALLFLSVAATNAMAQLVSGDVFMQGNYVELGLAPNGAFGSKKAAPAGYHPRTDFGAGTSFNGIGFVADPAKDGWTVGSPAYYGDYFLPGDPQEGWDFEIDGVRYKAWRELSSGTGMTGGLTGKNTSYTATSGVITGVWEGAGGNLAITQTTFLKTNKVYFVVSVNLKNTGTTTLHNIYYNRTVDPDNEETLTGEFSTDNKIVYKLPSTGNKTLVTATGPSYADAYLGLGSKDCRAKPYIIDSTLEPSAPLSDIYAQSGKASAYTFATGTTVSADIGLGIVFKIDSLLPGASTSLAYAYILKEEDLDSAFLDIEPVWSNKGVNYASGDTIKACIGSSLDLSIINAGYYDTWSWLPTSGVSTPTSSTATVTVGSSPVTYTATGYSSICSSSIDRYITIMPEPVPDTPVVMSPINYCLGATATALTATGTGLRWYTAPSGDPGTTVAPIPPTAIVGSTTYYVSQSNGTCEGAQSAIVVNVHTAALPVVSSPLKLCQGTTAAALTAVGSGLKWYTSLIDTGTSVAPVPATTSAGTYTYYVTQSPAPYGCQSDKVALVVIVNAKPLAKIKLYGASSSDTCFTTGSLLQAYATPVVSLYQWYSSGLLLSGAVQDTLTAPIAGYYSVLLKDTNGCADSAFIIVKNGISINPTLSPTDVKICPDVSIMLYCSPALSSYSYTWQKDGTTFIPSGSTSATAINTTGVYQVRVTDLSGCSKLTNVVEVTNYPSMPKPTILRYDPVLLLDHTYSSYYWYRNNKPIPAANDQRYVLSFDGTYYAKVMDENGCFSYSDTIVVKNLGLSYTNQQQSISIYPNPSSGQVYIVAPFAVDVTVVDVAGRSLLQAQQVNTINLKDFADGVYIISCRNKEGELLYKTTMIRSAAALH